jgi:nitronate monooxygenase
MIRTSVCDLLQIDHPIALDGMGSVYAPELVAAVSGAGGLGAMGCHYLTPEQVHAGTAAIRELTNRPFALNFLLFDIEEDSFASALALRPSVIAFAWPSPEQDVKPYVGRAHAAGCKVTFMAGGVPEAVRAAQAGADVIIAQGTEGGGHVSWQTTMTLVPMVVDAVAPIPVLAAGGIADGRGLAAAIMLGADGVLLGTRFLASRNRRCILISSRRSWRATGTTRFSPKYRISRLGWSGPGRCRAPGATGSSNAGQDGNGHCVNIERKQGQRCKRPARVETSTKRFCRWAKMPGSFTISRLLPRSLAGSPKKPNAY